MPTSRRELGLGALLSAVAGATDVLAFTRLGGSFASIVTGNLAVVGVAVGRRDLELFAHTALAVAGYAVGVACGVAAGRGIRTGSGWSTRVTAICVVELVASGLGLGWWIADGGAPVGAAQYTTLGLFSLAMGLQSAAFRLVGVAGVTTTYFTGTLTGLLARLVSDRRVDVAAALALTALVAGAVAAGVLVATSPRWAALLPVALLVGAVLAGSVGSRTVSR